MSIGSAAGPIGLIVAGVIAAAVGLKKIARRATWSRPVSAARGIGVTVIRRSRRCRMSLDKGRHVGAVVRAAGLRKAWRGPREMQYKVGGLYQKAGLGLGKFGPSRRQLIGGAGPGQTARHRAG